MIEELCRNCKRPIEDCAKGWHEDVCHSCSLNIGDYLCGTWLSQLNDERT